MAEETTTTTTTTAAETATTTTTVAPETSVPEQTKEELIGSAQAEAFANHRATQ